MIDGEADSVLPDFLSYFLTLLYASNFIYFFTGAATLGSFVLFNIAAFNPFLCLIFYSALLIAFVKELFALAIALAVFYLAA